MVNINKVQQQRFWNMWRTAGALSQIIPATDQSDSQKYTGVDIGKNTAKDFFTAMQKAACKNTFALNKEKIGFYKKMTEERSLSPKEFVIVVVNADDVIGGKFAEYFVPDTNWDVLRKNGNIPFASGIVMKKGMADIIQLFDTETSKKLREKSDMSVVIIDHGVAEVFDANNLNDETAIPSRMPGRMRQFMNGEGDW